MKLVAFAAVTIMLSASAAFAGAGAPVPEKTEGGPPSGRPGVILDDAQCGAVWNKTKREGDTLSEANAAPFIVNFKLVDTNNDGKITQDEFKEGCKKGPVQEEASRPAGGTAGGQTPEQPTKP